MAFKRIKELKVEGRVVLDIKESKKLVDLLKKIDSKPFYDFQDDLGNEERYVSVSKKEKITISVEDKYVNGNTRNYCEFID